MNRISSALLVSLFGVIALSAMGVGAIVINEVELNPPGNATKWVELYNDGEEDVDIGGWVVTIVNTPWKGPIQIPEGTIISANSYYVAEGAQQWSQDYNGTVVLEDAAGIKVDETYFMTENDDSDFTKGRFPNGYDTDQKSDWKLMRASPGAENTMP